MEWTVVRRRPKRGSAASRSPAATPEVVGELSAAGKKGALARDLAKEMVALEISGEAKTEAEAEDDERLFAKMQRAIVKVEQSEFFLTFLKQMRDLEVIENLSACGEEIDGAVESGCKGIGLGKDLGENLSGCGEDIDGEVDSGCKGTGFGKDFGEEEGVPATAGSLVQLVVYGVGSLANSEVSRYQLALAVLLKGRMPAFENVYVFDPIMAFSECRVMLRLGCVPLKDNDEGRLRLNGPTLMYMPHCDVELYESVLRAHLKPGGTEEIVILGNSFRTYQERWSVSPLPQGERPVCLLRVQPSVEEVPVVDQFSVNAFNDTSWHFFSKAGVS